MAPLYNCIAGRFFNLNFHFYFYSALTQQESVHSDSIDFGTQNHDFTVDEFSQRFELAFNRTL